MNAVAGPIETFRIDLNMLRGNKIRTRRDFAERQDDLLPNVKVGDLVRAVEADGDTFLATVESVEGLRVALRLDLESQSSVILTREPVR